MQSAFGSRGLIKITSIVQIVLALVGVDLLFETEWAWYKVPGFEYPASGYRTFSVWYNAPSNAAMGLLTAGFAVLFVCVALFGLRWGWLSSGRTATRYARLTIVLGLLVIALSAVAVAVVAVQRTSVYPDACPSLSSCGVSWWLGTALTSFLVGGFIFVVIGFLGTRMTGRGSQMAQTLGQAQTSCSNCGSFVPQNSKFCPKCGKEQSAPQHQSPAATERGLNSCPNCGSQQATGDAFCGHCGKQL